MKESLISSILLINAVTPSKTERVHTIEVFAKGAPLISIQLENEEKNSAANRQGRGQGDSDDNPDYSRTTTIFVIFIFISICFTQQPTYEIPSGSNVVFVETFSDGGERWLKSANEKYAGEWNVREANEPIKINGEKGLVAENDAKHHGIMVPFEKTLDNKDKDLVIQYEVRLMNGLQCGGAYIKLLTKEFLPAESSEFKDDTPYTIMFGPDRCGTSDKVHFIFRHKNPISNTWEEKHLNKTSPIKTDSLSHLYTIHITPDNKYNLYIDLESVSSGSIFENFHPPINPPSSVDDPEDKKPSNWVDEEKIPDSSAKKPDDWDENAPSTIIDTTATKPEGWLDNEPLQVPDPESLKPEDWDDDLDGEYEAPSVENPKCHEIGCGEWKPPVIANPAYKGKWKSPMIPNPAYKGEWKPKQIPNPNYFEDKNPYHFAPMGAIGIEIWTMQGGILYDNIIVPYDKNIADNFAENTWKLKKVEEQKLKELNEPKESMIESAMKPLAAMIEKIYIYAGDKNNLPVVIGSLIAGLLVPILMCFCLSGGKKKIKVI